MFAAASLTDAFEEVGTAFEAANPGRTVEFNFAASSALREQILAGAPADVFASANTSNMDQVVEGGAAAEPETFVKNLLQIAVPAGNPAGVTGLADFANADLLIGLCAEEVPCGEFGREALANAGVTPSIDTNEPDVRSLLTKVEAGELDAGIVYVTDVLSAGDAVEGIDIPADDNVIATYPIAALDRRRQQRGRRRVRRRSCSPTRARRSSPPTASTPHDPAATGREEDQARAGPPGRSSPSRPSPSPSSPSRSWRCCSGRRGPTSATSRRARRHRRAPAEHHHRLRRHRASRCCSGSRWPGCWPAPGSPAAPRRGRSSPCRWCSRRWSAAPRCCSRSGAGACSAARSTTRPGSCCPFSTWGVVAANTFVAMPFLVLTVESGLRAADPRYEDAAATLGASRWMIFRRITVPHAAPSIIAGAVLCWARALGEFGATVTFAGNLQGRTQTMPLAVFLALESDRDAAIALSLVLIAVSLAVLLPLRDRWLAV